MIKRKTTEEKDACVALCAEATWPPWPLCSLIDCSVLACLARDSPWKNREARTWGKAGTQQWCHPFVARTSRSQPAHQHPIATLLTWERCPAAGQWRPWVSDSWRWLRGRALRRMSTRRRLASGARGRVCRWERPDRECCFPAGPEWWRWWR